MAEFSGMALTNEARGLLGGCIFDLDHDSRSSSIEEIDGWEVEIQQGCRSVVVRGPSFTSYDDALRQSIPIVHRGLDVLSLRGTAHHKVVNIENEHILWWTGPQGLTLRYVTMARTSMSLYASVSVKDAAGDLIPMPTPPLTWHESFRYFRLSQTTDDLFDAYRNLFLALESILSDLVPNTSNANETTWLKAAFTAVATNGWFDFAQALPTATDPVMAVFQDLYEKRNACFHAKSHRPHLMPYDPAARREIQVCHERLRTLYLALVKHKSGFYCGSGGMTYDGFEMMTASIQNAQLLVTDDVAPCDAADTTINPGGGHVVALTTRPMTEWQQPFTKYFFGMASGQELTTLTHIGRCASTIDNKILYSSILDARLMVEGVAMFEVVMGIQIEFPQQGKKRYAS